jgi:hypothetical protein
MSSSKKTKIFLNNKRISSNSSTKDSNNKIQILNKGPWSDKEDQLLRNWVNKHGAYNWTKCSEYIKGRSGKQCREHWNNSLDPELLKGQWTSEEDLLIMIFYEKYDGSWKKIIPIFKNRTENSIKNRFFSQLRKIVSKNQPNGKKEYSTKFGLEILKQYLPKATEIAKKKFFDEKTMNEKEFDEYVIKIDNLVKNRKKGNKFIELKLIKDKKNNLIDINEDTNENNYEEEQNKITPRKRKKRGRKKLDQNKNKDKDKEKDVSFAREETINKEDFLTYEETIKPIESDLNNNNDNNNVNKIFNSQKSKKNIFKNEIVKEEKIKNNNDNFLIPNNVVKDNKNNLNNLNKNYFEKKYNEEKKTKNFNEYKIDKNNINNINMDEDSKGSMDEVNKQIQKVEEDTIQKYNKFKKNYRNYREKNCSKNIEYNIKNGINIIPFESFDNNNDFKESNINIGNINIGNINIGNKINNKNKNEEKMERKNSFIKNLNKKISFGFFKKKSSEMPLNLYEISNGIETIK